MKKIFDFCLGLLKKINLKDFLQVVLIGLLLYAGGWCMEKYQAWNIIPSHQIEAHLSAEGLISDKSFCNLKINIDAGGFYLLNDSFERSNIIELFNSSQYTDSIKIDKLYNGKCSYIYRIPKYKKALENKCTFYFLDFKTHTNISSKYKNRDYLGICDYNKFTFNYMEDSKLRCDSLGTHSGGIGFLAYDRWDGDGWFLFNTNLLNSSPSFNSPWDITQANYFIDFKCSNIRCDTITIEFIGATTFSAMYPNPNRITVSSIQFTDSNSINEIMKNGLRFHTEFVQMKELSSRRTFVLSAVFSLLVSLFASIVFTFIFHSK